MICKKLFSFRESKDFCVVCLVTMSLLLPLQAQDSSLKAKQFEGKLVFHKDIPVGLVSGSAEHPKLIEVKSIRFEMRYTNAWGLTARVGWLPAKETKWQLKVELVDENGHVLPHSRDETTVFTCKSGAPGEIKMLYADLDLDSMHDRGRRHATKFRVHLKPLEKKTPTAQSTVNETHTLEVRVVDKENQKPIADASVVLSSFNIKHTYLREKTLYQTDSKGRCHINLAKDGLSTIGINAQKQGFATILKTWSNYGSSLGRAPLVNLPQQHVLEMVHAGSAGGIVQDTEGKVIEAAEVHFYIHLQEPTGIINIRRSVQTDANGRWRVDGVPSEIDRITLRLRHPEYGGDISSSRRITAKALLNARALRHIETLKKGLTITGKVINEQGNPVVRATVLTAQRSYSPIYTLTDMSGAFRLVIPSDASVYRETPALIVEAPGYVPVQQTIYIKPKIEPLEFRLRRGRSVTCSVVDIEGQPITGAWTVVEPMPENTRYSVWLKDTNKRGEFKIPNIPEKDINLTIGKLGYIAVRDFILPVSEEKVVVTMKRALQVNGTVTDAQSGKPIPNFEIAAVTTFGGRSRTGNPATFIEGKYNLSFDEANPETRQIKVSAVGYEPFISEEIGIDEGQRTIDFKLKKDPSFDTKGGKRSYGQARPTGPRKIVGVVLDEKGKPVSDAVVSVQPQIAEDTITDAKGAFTLRIRRSSMGSMSSRQEITYLIVRHKKHNLATAIELDDDAETLNIKLAPGVILSGKVVNAEGKGIPDPEISLTFWLSEFGYSSKETANIDSLGNYEIRAVPSGHRYSVTASAKGYGQQSVRVETAEAIDGRMEFEPFILEVANLSVSGQVVDVDGKPVVGARIYSYGRGQPNRNTITDITGRFLIENICEGRIQIQANTNSQPTLYGRVDTEGGATDVTMVVSQRGMTVRYVPKKPPSLVGKSLPDFKDLKIKLSSEDTDNKMLLVCFFDMEQRPSRYRINQLDKKVQELKAKDVVAVAVQASKIDENKFNDWIKKYNTPFPVGMVESNEEKIRFSWGVRSLPWLILTDKEHIVHTEGFALSELDEKIEEAAL